jgi:RecA-family ATPase
VVNGFALDEHQAMSVLSGWNACCQPPWSEKDLRHKIADAIRLGHVKGRGFLLRASSYRPNTPSTANRLPAVKPARASYDLSDFTELPDAVEDGARLLLKTCFQPGEGVRIVNARLDDDGGEIPDGAGPCLSREEWLRKLDAGKGNPNSIFSSSKKTGIYICINPLKIGGSKDADVTAFRHALLEFDKELSPEEQFNLYQKSRLPCAAIIFSGKKSVHAWVKIDAVDRQEYDDRVRMLYDHFESSGYKIDVKNKNPSRLSRLPNCIRFDGRQELLAVSTTEKPVGCESFSEWQGEVQADGIGKLITPDDLDEYDPTADDSLLIGNEWVCRCEPFILNGASGIGKSSLAYQMGFAWSVGVPMFGIKPKRPLRVLVIQAENSKRYLKKIIKSLRDTVLPFSGENSEELWELHRNNFAFVHEATHTQIQFIEILRRWIDKWHPDLVIIDPLLAYCPTVSKIEDCARFCREWLQPVLDSTKTAAFLIHHTGKTSTDPRSRKGWNLTDFSYAGLGSSDLPNYVRASMTLDQCGDGAFRLMFTKRTWEAGARHPDETPADTIWLRHAERGKGVHWLQTDRPTESKSEDAKPKEKKLTIGEQIAQKINTSSFLNACPKDGEGLREIVRRLSAWLQSKDCKDKLRQMPSDGTLRNGIACMVANDKLLFVSNVYVKGPNA